MNYDFLTEAQMNTIGRNFARILKLRRDPDHKDRWQTEFGSKTDLGLFLTINNLVTSVHEGKIDPELFTDQIHISHISNNYVNKR